MSKKLNIIEAMKMPIGTEFKVEFDGEKIPNNTMIVSLDFVGTKEYKTIDWKSHPKDSFMRPFDFLINGVFILIQQPVSFMEVVDSDKRCRVEHEAITNFLKNKKSNEYCFFQDNKYHHLTEIVSILSYVFYPALFNRVVKEAKWYIEESEELEDEN